MLPSFTRPRRFDRNLIIIGGGAAGLVTAYVAAALRAKVTLVEAHRLGGDCLNTGCVPSKALIRTARLAHQMRHADRYGLAPALPGIRLRDVMDRVNRVIRDIEPHDSRERYEGLGVEVIEGYARLIDPWTVDIARDPGARVRLTTRAIVLATGAAPVIPEIRGITDVQPVTSDTLWDALSRLDEVPQRMLVLGGGPIGCELAQCFARLGSKVSIVEQASGLLPREDDDVRAFVRETLETEGVTVRTGTTVEAFSHDGAKVAALSTGGVQSRVEFDLLLCAVGRAARLKGYGLEELGIPSSRFVDTNTYLETTPYPHILAAGDVAGPLQFTHAAGHQGRYAAVNALFGHLKRSRAQGAVIPMTTFVDPEVARVGLTEGECRSRGVPFETTLYDLADLDRAITDSAARGFVKVLTAPGRDRILGAVVVAEHAGELIGEFALAMTHGIGLGRILDTVHTYPTFLEANRYAASSWKRAHAPERILDWMARYHAWRRG